MKTQFLLSGIYQLDVSSPRYVFSQVKIKVTEDDAILAVEYPFPGAPKSPNTKYPLVLPALTKVDYFEKKQEMSVIKMITGNPMMIMMALSFGAMMFMPKMMEGMDKEQLKEIQAQQGDPMANMKKLFGMEQKEEEDD